jgi:NDP-sugar pyrophosphorylase family protein
MSKTKTAVILAGGKGTRLRPYTWILPKPLMPLGEQPILEVVIRQLAQAGFLDIILAVNHQADMIKAVIRDGRQFGVKVRYSMENKLLSTMGPLKLMRGLPENFLVMNGDILTDLNFRHFHDDHVKGGQIFTISSHEREHKIDYGVLKIDDKHRLTAFQEKPKQHFHVSMGIYMLNREVLGEIPRGEAFGFDHLMLKLLEKNKTVKVKPHRGLWLDIGRPDDFHQAVELFEAKKLKFLRKSSV